MSIYLWNRFEYQVITAVVMEICLQQDVEESSLSVFQRIIQLENGKRNRKRGWRSGWRKCQILATTVSQENWKCLHHYTTMLISNCSTLIWWNIRNEHSSLKNETQSQQSSVQHLKTDCTLSTGLYNFCCTNCWIVYGCLIKTNVIL